MKDFASTALPEFMSAIEMARLAAKLPSAGFPTTESGVIRFVKAKGWDGSQFSRKRAGRGGGIEYSVAILPDALRAALEAQSIKGAVVARQAHEVETANRAVIAIRMATLSERPRAVMQARAEILLAIDGYAVAMGESRAWAIQRFIESLEAYAARQDAEARRDAGEILTPSEADGLARPLVLTAPGGFHLAPPRIATANDRKALVMIRRRTVYDWFKARGDLGVIGLAPVPPKQRLPIPEGFSAFLRHYAKPAKPSIPEAYRDYVEEIEARRGVQPMALSQTQVEYFVRHRMNNVEKMVGREGLLTLRSRLAYVTRTDDDMWPTTVYTADGKTFDAEIADPATNHPIRPEITTVLDVVTRKIVGISLARSENQRSVAEALRNACIGHGIPAIFYVDRGPGYRNEALDADVGGLMGRLGITKMHAAPYGSQAKGRIEIVNKTVWNTLSKRFATYIGSDMDKEAGQLVHKITRREMKEFGVSQKLPSWAEFVRACLDMVAEYNTKPHSSLPKIEDAETGKQRHMSPNEAWEAHVTNGFEPVSVDPSEADDLFRPYEIRTALRAEVQWNTNKFFHLALEPYHQQKVMVGYDYHQADRVWVREFNVHSGQPGKLICVAIFAGNAERYVPLSYEQKAVETRAQGRLGRLDRKRASVEAERDALMIEHQPTISLPIVAEPPEPMAVVAEPAQSTVIAAIQPRRRVFASDEELALWALEHPTELSPNQIGILKDCLARPSARELFRMSGIDTEALRTLLRAAA